MPYIDEYAAFLYGRMHRATREQVESVSMVALLFPIVPLAAAFAIPLTAPGGEHLRLDRVA